MKKTVPLTLVLVLLSTAVAVRFVRPVEASGTITIKADGSIEGTTDISTVDNVTYTFTDNINASIIIERDNIVVDGAGYTLQGIGSSEGIGINLTERSNVTIKNMEIKAFHSGIRLSESYENTISENNITNIHYGIWLRYSSNFNNISGNNILDSYCGIEFEGSSGSTISGNNIINNERGICLFGASNNNTISGNNMTENSSLGIWLAGPSNITIIGNNITNNLSGMILGSSNSVLRNNNMTNNEYNFVVSSLGVLHACINDVDISNTVNGKPVYYWINKRDMNIPIDAGYVALVNCTRINVQNLSLTHNGQGILLAYTTNSTVIKDDITNNGHGIVLFESSNNTIIGNNMTNNMESIRISLSSHNIITENSIENNEYSLEIWGSSHNIITHNNITANDEPGIGLYNSSHNIMSENKIIDNYEGIRLGSGSSNNSITGNNMSHNSDGIWLEGSVNNNHIDCNTISANTRYGIYLLYASNHNHITQNNITANQLHGMWLWNSSYNQIIGNRITDNGIERDGFGIRFWEASNNAIYHNNFIDNNKQFFSFESENTWDDGYPSGGNYWSDYNGTDAYYPGENTTGLPPDGIGDTPYTIDANNADRYPLMGPISFFNAGTWNEVTYYVDTISNSTVSDFHFSRDDKLASFNVNGTGGTVGFSRVAIPKDLLWCDNLTEWNVTINSNPPTYLNIKEDDEYTYLYFRYNHSIQEVQIKGIYVIPEFPTWTSIFPILILLTVAIVVYKRRLLKTPIH